MSYDLTKLPPEVAALVQTGLKALGFYQGTTKGLPGPKTEAAFENYLETRGSKPANPAAKTMIDAMIRIARAEVGTRESGGNNRGPRIQQYQDGASWVKGTGWAWCAAFVAWVFDELAKQFTLPFATPEGAGAFWFEDWGRQQGLTVLGPRAKVKRGDLVIYSFSHIGIASSDEKNGKFTAIEGNTNDSGSRDGDGVFEKTRSKSLVRAIVRPFA